MYKHPNEVNNFMKNVSGTRYSKDEKILATFENKYGEQKKIHITRSGLRVKRDSSTIPLLLNKKIGNLVGAKIRTKRLALGWTLEEVGKRAGISGSPIKNRMWMIENDQAKQGLRFGTLYAIAMAFECPITDLLPTLEEATEAAGIKKVKEDVLKSTI